MTAENTTATDTSNASANTGSASSPGGGLSTADLANAGQQSNTGGNGDTAVETRPAGGTETAPLFGQEEAQGFREQWTAIQTGFVDDPRQAVQQADELVAQTIQRLAQIFADERNTLENQWSSGQNVSTEDLRQALQRYRSFFDRLLSV